jgi:hypothetical protein
MACNPRIVDATQPATEIPARNVTFNYVVIRVP